MNKTRIKDYMSIIKKLEKTSAGGVLKVSKDPAEGRVYFCNGCSILSITYNTYYDLLKADADCDLLKITEDAADPYKKFMDDFNNEETTNGRDLPFMFNIYDKTCNIIKSFTAAGDAVFTVVNSVYFSIMKTLDKYDAAPIRCAAENANKKPVSICDPYTESVFLVLPVLCPDLAQKAAAAFNIK